MLTNFLRYILILIVTAVAVITANSSHIPHGWHCVILIKVMAVKLIIFIH